MILTHSLIDKYINMHKDVLTFIRDFHLFMYSRALVSAPASAKAFA